VDNLYLKSKPPKATAGLLYRPLFALYRFDKSLARYQTLNNSSFKLQLASC